MSMNLALVGKIEKAAGLSLVPDCASVDVENYCKTGGPRCEDSGFCRYFSAETIVSVSSEDGSAEGIVATTTKCIHEVVCAEWRSTMYSILSYEGFSTFVDKNGHCRPFEERVETL